MEDTCVGESFHNNSFAIIEMIVINIIPNMCTIMIPIPPMPFYLVTCNLPRSFGGGNWSLKRKHKTYNCSWALCIIKAYH